MQPDTSVPGSSTVEFSVEGGLATVRMNRPDAHNAINAAMAAELYEAAMRCANDPAIRAVLLLGNGKSFSVGGDLKVFANTKESELPACCAR